MVGIAAAIEVLGAVVGAAAVSVGDVQVPRVQPFEEVAAAVWDATERAPPAQPEEGIALAVEVAVVAEAAVA